jgi:transposase-like protein
LNLKSRGDVDEKRQSHKKYLAIKLILEDGMSVSAAAEMVGEPPGTVGKWLADYLADQEEKLLAQEADLIEKKRQLAETQEEIRMRRALYDLVIDRPDPKAEKAAKKYWEAIPEKVRHKIITKAFCID